MTLVIHQIRPNEVAQMEALLAAFGEAFDDVDTYIGNQPSVDYLRFPAPSD